jgi:hypothetical protein
MRTLSKTSEEHALEVRKNSDFESLWITILSVALLGLGFLSATDFWSFRTSLVLDDYHLCRPGTTVGSIWADYWVLTGLYRPLTFPVVALRTLTCDFFWVHKVLGLALHLAVAAGLWRFGRQFGLKTPAAFAAAALFIFNPFALEAVAWPAVVYGYPLTALFLVCYALVVASGRRTAVALILGFLAVMTNEQTLPLVMLLPLVLTLGAWRERLRRASVIVGPTLILFVVTVVSGRLVNNQRASAIGASGVDTIAQNLAEHSEILTWPLPGSELWLAFSEGGTSPIPLLGWVAVALATLIAFRGYRRDPDVPSSERWAVKAAMGLGASLLLMLPFYAQGYFSMSPRYFYLPYLTMSLAIGFLAEWLTRKVRYVDFVVLALPILIFAVVADGLAAEAAAYRETFEQERATAEALAITLEHDPDASQLVLLDDPWLFAMDRPIFGEHLVQAFSVGWAVPGAVDTFTDYDIQIPVLIDTSGFLLCEQGGEVYLSGESFDENARDVVLFSVTTRERVGRLIVGEDGLPIYDHGIERTVLPCPES